MRCRERTCAESSGGTASGPRAVSSLGLCRKSCGLRGVAEATAAGAPEASVVLPRGVMLGSWMPMSEPFASTSDALMFLLASSPDDDTFLRRSTGAALAQRVSSASMWRSSERMSSLTASESWSCRCVVCAAPASVAMPFSSRSAERRDCQPRVSVAACAASASSMALSFWCDPSHLESATSSVRTSSRMMSSSAATLADASPAGCCPR